MPESPSPDRLAAPPPDRSDSGGDAGALAARFLSPEEMAALEAATPEQLVAQAFPGDADQLVRRAVVGPGEKLEAVGLDDLVDVARNRRKKVLADGQRALQKVRAGNERDLTANEKLGLQALVATVSRPAILFQSHIFLQPPPTWLELDRVYREQIQKAAKSVGRIDIPDHPSLPYAGTGFLVATDVVMTNAHVANLFARKAGRKWMFTQSRQGIGFDDDPRAAAPPYTFESILGVHPKLDLALVRVRPPADGAAEMPPPLVLTSARPDSLKGRKIYVLGYPAADERRGAPLMRLIFADVYNVKRLQPGRVLDTFDAAGYFHHDCSTLGGNSGSCVINVESNLVVGLHTGGTYLKFNRAINLWALRDDPLLKRAKVRFD